MRAPFIAFLSVAFLPAVSGAQQQADARWTPLLVTAGESVEIDLTALERTNGTVVTSLRWDLDRNSPEWLGGEYLVERVELDCAHARIRVLAASRIPWPGARKAPSPVLTPTDTTRTATAVVLTPSDTTWHTYSPGSLGAQAVREACRRLTRA